MGQQNIEDSAASHKTESRSLDRDSQLRSTKFGSTTPDVAGHHRQDRRDHHGRLQVHQARQIRRPLGT